MRKIFLGLCLIVPMVQAHADSYWSGYNAGSDSSAPIPPNGSQFSAGYADGYADSEDEAADQAQQERNQERTEVKTIEQEQCAQMAGFHMPGCER